MNYDYTTTTILQGASVSSSATGGILIYLLIFAILGWLATFPLLIVGLATKRKSLALGAGIAAAAGPFVLIAIGILSFLTH